MKKDYCMKKATLIMEDKFLCVSVQEQVGKSWINVKTWTAASSSIKTSLVKTKSAASSSSYRVKATFKSI